MTSASDADSARSVTKADLEAILDSLVEGIVILDGEGRILGINRAACEILEVDKDEAVAANCCEMMGKQLCESAAAVRDSIRSYRPLSDVQVQVQTRSGRKKVIVFQTRMLHRADDGTPRKPGSLGSPRAGIEVKLLDDDDREVAPGEVGEFCVRPSEPYTIFHGYFHRPEATLEAFRTLWYHTGDLGRRDEDGDWFFVDRKAPFSAGTRRAASSSSTR